MGFLDRNSARSHVLRQEDFTQLFHDVNGGQHMHLRVLDSNSPSAPYPPDTKANGYKPEFDIDRIATSDTWTLADDDEHPWLLRIWFEAWRSVPAGSMPADLKLFARRIRCSEKFLQAHRENLLRGWRLYQDGRLYHDFITEQVLQMLAKRRKSAEKVRAWREEKNKEKQAYKADGNQDVTGNQPVSNRQETGTGTGNRTQDISTTPVGVVPPQTPKAPVAAQTPPCPHKEIIALYHEHMPNNPRVRTWEGRRPEYLRARWKKYPSIDWWKGFFSWCAESPFLTMRVPGKGGPDEPPFVVTLEWMLKPSNFAKIYEGNYHRRK